MRKTALLFAGALVALVTSFGLFRAYAHRLVNRRDSIPKRAITKAPFDPKKPTIFMVHGLSGSAYQLDLVLRPTLERFANVETFDIPGHGDTDPLPREIRNIEGLVEALRTAFTLRMQELGLEKVSVLAISLGGEITLRLAIDHPDLFTSVTLFEPPYRGEYASVFQRKGYQALYRLYRMLKPGLDPLSKQVLIETVWDISHNFGGIEEDHSTKYESVAVRETNEHASCWNDRQKHGESLLDYVRMVLSYDGKEHIGRYDPNLPTLLIKGEETNDAIVATTDALYNDLFPKMRAPIRKVSIPGLKHRALYRFPTLAAEILESFYQEIGLLP